MAEKWEKLSNELNGLQENRVVDASYEEGEIREIAETVRRLTRLARADVEDALWDNPKRLAEVAFGNDGMYLCVPGVDGPAEDGPALVIQVRDMITGSKQPHLTYDPIAAVIDAYGDGAEGLEAVNRAIGTLEAGIQRLQGMAHHIKEQLDGTTPTSA